MVCERLCVKMINKKGVGEPPSRPTPTSVPELFIGWFVLDVEDLECFEVTYLTEDDTEFELGTVLCVTKMAVQRGEKSWFSIDADKAVTHGLQTWQELVRTEVMMQVIGYGDDAYVRISQFWRDYKAAPRANKPDPLELLQAAPAVDPTVPPPTHVYPVDKLGERYNGRGLDGTGGPKLDWLRVAGTQWIGRNNLECTTPV